MPFERPTLSALRDRIANDIEFRIAKADAHTPGTGYTELAQVVAGVAHGLYSNQQWMAAQLFVDSADDDTVVQNAAARGIPRIEASFANGNVTFTGNNGATIGSEVMLQTSGGAQFRTTAIRNIVGGTATAPVTAMDAGVAGNLATGTVLSLINPIAGIDNNATVAAPGLANGADIESMTRVRERLKERLQEPPMGGNDYDYRTWVRAASIDVSRVWVFQHESGIGSVTVRFVAEDLANPIPNAGLITTVTNYLATKRPAGLRSLTVAAPTAVPMNLVFTALSPNTADVRAAIEAEIKDLIRREYEPGGTLLLSHIREAISRATGETDYVITLSGSLNYTNSQFPTWGVPTWPGA